MSDEGIVTERHCTQVWDDTTHLVQSDRAMSHFQRQEPVLARRTLHDVEEIASLIEDITGSIESAEIVRLEVPDLITRTWAALSLAHGEFWHNQEAKCWMRGRGSEGNKD